MKLSTKGEYGLRAMFDLAQRFGSGPKPLNSIAKRQNISEYYLEHLIADLRKAGLVKSVRGSQGGYMLAKKPDEIKVGEIIRVLEGPIAPTNCVSEEEVESCIREDICVTRVIWKRVRDSIKEVLDSTTLEDMCIEAEKMCASNSSNHKYTYHI